MNDKPINPLTDEHLEVLNTLLKRTNQTGEYLNKCKECGIDVEDSEMKNTQQQDIASRIKSTFFPRAK